MTKDEALKMALEALHGFIPYLPLNDEAQCGRYDEAITAIKEALKEKNT
jgi:predicted RNase H-like HicB family nuclease